MLPIGKRQMRDRSAIFAPTALILQLLRAIGHARFCAE
jgi:hypothetical protein